MSYIKKFISPDSGIRVAYSALGKVTSLTGVPEGEVAVEAVGQGPDCAEYQEEALTDQSGAFRIRGLLPKCQYLVGLKSGPGINKHIERMLPPVTAVQVTNKLPNLIVSLYNFDGFSLSITFTAFNSCFDVLVKTFKWSEFDLKYISVMLQLLEKE